MLMQFNALRLMIQYLEFQTCLLSPRTLYIAIVPPALNDFQWAREIAKNLQN